MIRPIRAMVSLINKLLLSTGRSVALPGENWKARFQSDAYFAVIKAKFSPGVIIPLVSELSEEAVDRGRSECAKRESRRFD